MCGISAFTTSNPRHDVATVLYQAEAELARSRGDASWGLVLHADDRLVAVKGLGAPIPVAVQTTARAGKQGAAGIPLVSADFSHASAGVAHNRLPSLGRVSLQNAHPFLAPDGSWALAHNGHVPGPIPFDEAGYHPVGETDSERLLYAFLTHLDHGLGVAGALREVLRLPGRTNLVLLNPQGQVVVLASDSLHRRTGSDYVLYASIPVDVPALGIRDTDPGWVRVARGTVETAHQGRVRATEFVARFA